MDEPRDWPAVLSPPQRNNFFFGKMMGVAQFEREQCYGMGQRWLINRLTIGTGVLCGLEVTLTADGKRLRVAPGVAVDPWGREIVVSHPVDFDPFAAGGGCVCSDGAPIAEAKDYILCLTYRECAANDQPVQYADDCPGQPDCQPDTIVETFGLALSDVVAPAAFDCDKWTAAVPTHGVTSGPGRRTLSEVTKVPAPRPALGGDLTRPARPPRSGVLTDPRGTSSTPAGGTTPPSIDLLRARLAEQLGSSCAVPNTTCVPLALVTAKKDGDMWTLTVADGPRRRVYTQAQMLEMILCLAACCGGHHDEPPSSETLRVTGIEFMRVVVGGPQTNFPARLEPASPRNPGGYPLVFDVRSTRAVPEPIAIRVSFNKAIEGSTVTMLPSIASAPLGYALMVAPLDAPPGQDVEAPVVTSILEEANVVLLICPGDAGAYKIIMRGDPVPPTPPATGPGLPAITTWDPDPTKRRRLDGEVDATRAQFPSGKAGDGGNFEYKYELRTPDLFRIERVGFVKGTTEQELKKRTGTIVPTTREVDRIRIVFSAPVDVDTARAGVTIISAGGAVAGGIESDPKSNKAVLYIHRAGGVASPFPPGKYDVTLSAAQIKDVPGIGTTARSLAGTAHSPDPPLPSGGAPGADNFVFDFTAKAP